MRYRDDSNFLLWCGGGIAAAFVAFMGFLIKTAYDNHKEMQETILKIDRGLPVIFTSKQDCISQDFSAEECGESFKKAQSFVGGLGTSVSYTSKRECKDIHGYCDCVTTVEETYSNLEVSEGVSIPQYSRTESTECTPDVVAWQAQRGRISLNAVPLYGSVHSGMAWRQDGRTFALPSSTYVP